MTLSEIILVIGLLATVMVAMLTLFSQGLNSMTRADQTETANSVARQLLEQIQGQPGEDGVFDGNLPSPTVNGFPPAPYPFSERTRRYVLVIRASSLSTRLRRIQVEVQTDGRRVLELEKVVLK